jgi:hypothetical protein
MKRPIKVGVAVVTTEAYDYLCHSVLNEFKFQYYRKLLPAFLP